MNRFSILEPIQNPESRIQKCLLWAFALAIVTGARADTPYVNQSLGFGFTPPSGWTQKKHPDVVVAFIEPKALPPRPAVPSRRESDAEFVARVSRSLKTPLNQQTTFQANLMVMMRQAGNVTLAQYARDTRAQAARSRTYRILSEKNRRLGGEPAVERLVRLVLPGQPTVLTREILCVRGGRLFTITFTAPWGSFRKYTTEFDKVLASFVWRN